MADDLGFQPLAPAQPSSDDIGFQPIPKMPDTSGIQQSAKDNLAANDNEGATPAQKLDTAVGAPVSAWVKGSDKDTPLSPELRGHYVKSVQAGTSNDFGDFMQSALHSVLPILANTTQNVMHPVEYANKIIEAAKSSAKAIPSLLAYPLASDESKQELLKNFPEVTSYENTQEPSGAETYNRGLELFNATVGSAVGGLFPEAAIISPAISPLIDTAGGQPHKEGEPLTWAQTIPGTINAAMALAGGFGAKHIAGEYGKLRAERNVPIDRSNPPSLETPPAGPWDNLPGADSLRQPIAETLKKSADSVSSSDIDQYISATMKDKAPPASDFKDVAAVTGANEKTLQVIFKQTGMKPEQVYEEAARNPEVLDDIRSGDVPESFPVEQNSAATPERLSVAADKGTSTFSVLDKDGDHVRGGFDSAEEAQQYIDDKLQTAAIEKQMAEVEKSRGKAASVDKTGKAKQPPTPNANSDAVDGDWLHTGVISKGTPGISIEAGKVRGTGAGARVFDETTKKYKALTAEEAESHGIPDEQSDPEKTTHRNAVFRDKDGKAIGVVSFDTDAPGSKNIIEDTVVSHVLPEARRQGIASSLYRHLREEGYNIDEVSGKGTLTPDGAAFANSRIKPTYERPADLEKTSTAEQQVIPGAEKASDAAMAQRGTEKSLKPSVAQKSANEGLFGEKEGLQGDLLAQEEETAPQKPKPLSVIPSSETGKPTSLRTFLLNNGAKLNEANELLSIKKNGERISGGDALEYAHEIAKEHGYLPKDEANQPARPLTDLQNALADNGGKETTRAQDADRVAKAKEAAEARKNFDPAKIEHEAHSAGLDTDRVKGEGDKAYINRLKKALTEFYKNERGAGEVSALREIMGGAIKAMESLGGKLTGDFFEKLGQAYIRTFQPELVSDKALRFDAYLAKNKAKIQESENAFYRASEAELRRWDRASLDQQKEWLYDHETGRWNEEENADHTRQQAIYDAMRKSEQDAGVGNQAYKENYLPHQYENPEGVQKFFNSDAMIKKYGKDWFNKASEFRLIQDADRAGFKMKTYNPERMLLDRRLASYALIAQMDLLKDLESSGLATRTSTFTLDKKIARTQDSIADLEKRYKEASDKINDPRQETWDFANPAVSKLMRNISDRLADLKSRLEDFTKQKTESKLTPAQLDDLKNGFKIIGPDSKAWNIHPDGAAIWKNAMDLKGLYENQDVAGSAYRSYMAAKAVYVRQKMMASLFHPTHEVVIDVSSDMASAVHHLVQGGKISDLLDKKMIPNIGLGEYTAKLQDNPQVTAWNTPAEERTPEQQAHVDRMIEGGFVPTVPRQDAVNFKENFNKAISGIGKQNLRLLGMALELPGLPMKPLMEHWIPGMKTESYFQRTDLALARDPSLANDAGRRAEVFRSIAKDIERNYGEMNRKTQFWNPIVRDIFNATTFSGGWKLAMLQNFRGLAEPAKIAYNWAKTGEFSKEQITHQMLQSYIYTANMLMLGAGLNYMFTGTVGTLKDWITPQTGDKNPDGGPIRLRQPAFFNEPIMLMHDANEDGVVAGTGKFLYHQTLIPGIADSLFGRDFVGRPYITDPTDLHQWMNMGYDSISPIALTNQEKSEQKASTTASVMGWVGFPIAGGYIDQTPFEQKIIGEYYHLHPSDVGAYQAKLKGEMRGAVANKDLQKQASLEKEMIHEGMTSSQIAHSREQHTESFAKFAWGKLSAENQKRLIESAPAEEKAKYQVK